MTEPARAIEPPHEGAVRRGLRGHVRSEVALAVQAGGRSRRMGEDKAFLPFGDGTLLEWMRGRLAPSFPHVFLVANDAVRFRSLGLPVVNDALPEAGSAVGIYTAVLASPTERVLCLACDMPFVTPRLLRCLAEGSAGFDVFVPRHGEYLQPLCAVYGKRTALPAFQALFEAGEHRSTSIADSNTGYLDMDDGRSAIPSSSS